MADTITLPNDFPYLVGISYMSQVDYASADAVFFPTGSGGPKWVINIVDSNGVEIFVGERTGYEMVLNPDDYPPFSGATIFSIPSEGVSTLVEWRALMDANEIEYTGFEEIPTPFTPPVVAPPTVIPPPTEPCHGCGASINCPGDEIFPYSLTPGTEFPFVINCPSGVDCTAALTIAMMCCGTQTTLNIPAGTSDAERAALIQQLIAQCAFINNGCPTGGGGGGNDPEPPVTTYFFNQRQVGSSDCAARYGGGTFYFPMLAGTFISTSLAQANTLALQAANRLALARKFCLSVPCLCPCADVATTINISTVGGVGPFSYEITSGTLPTGMTLTVVGGILRLAGTPTVSGSSAITLKVYDQSGGWLYKTLTIYVLKITTTSPLTTPVIGVAYSKQIVGTGGTGNYSFSIISGSLPTGLTMSAAGLITGTPTAGVTATFTVRMRDVGLNQTTGGCEKEFEFIAASLIIYYSAANSAPWFDPGAPLGSIMAFDLSTIPGGNDLLEGSTGGVPKIVAGKLSLGWQGGFIDPNPDGASFPTGDCSGYWNYFPRIAAGLTNKFTMRFWFRIDPYLATELSYSSSYFRMIELESGYVSVQLDEPPNIFRVRATFFNGGTVDLTGSDIPLDALWHRVVVKYDPATDIASLQIDNDTPTTLSIPDVLPTDGKNAIVWAPNDAGIFQPPPDDSLLTLAQWCEFYIASDYIWSDAESTYDWNSGAGRTWPNVPGA